MRGEAAAAAGRGGQVAGVLRAVQADRAGGRGRRRAGAAAAGLQLLRRAGRAIGRQCCRLCRRLHRLLVDPAAAAAAAGAAAFVALPPFSIQVLEVLLQGAGGRRMGPFARAVALGLKPRCVPPRGAEHYGACPAGSSCRSSRSMESAMSQQQRGSQSLLWRRAPPAQPSSSIPPHPSRPAPCLALGLWLEGLRSFSIRHCTPGQPAGHRVGGTHALLRRLRLPHQPRAPSRCPAGCGLLCCPVTCTIPAPPPSAPKPPPPTPASPVHTARWPRHCRRRRGPAGAARPPPAPAGAAQRCEG